VWRVPTAEPCSSGWSRTRTSSAAHGRGCDRRVGLQVHHLWPKTWHGRDEQWNLAGVCTIHHAQLAPQGPLLLLGNPNNPAGLTLIHRDDLPDLADLAATQGRAGPEAA